MDPKPSPSSSLLLRNQRWVAIPALNWVLVTGPQFCYFSVGEDLDRCGNPGLVREAHLPAYSHSALCVDHMGYHLWVDDVGTVMQWRADPPYTLNKQPKVYERTARIRKKREPRHAK